MKSGKYTNYSNKFMILEILDYLCKRLDEEGFIVHYYKAFSTNSCYIKLDYGLANGVRISDHDGYEKYNYRFNLLTTLKKKYAMISDRGYPRYYYSLEDVEALVKDAIRLRDEKLNRYGEYSYQKLVEEEKENIKGRTGINGFWKLAKIYNKEECFSGCSI